MQIIVITVLCFLASYTIFSVYKRYKSSRYHARNAKNLGCQPAPFYTNRWPLGLDQIWDLSQADKRNETPNMLLSVLAPEDLSTIEISILGDTSILTTDPKNVQAILASQFQDFELGEARNDNVYPLLGRGIFSSDGAFWSHSRALLRPQFARDNIANLDSLESHVQLMFKHILVQPSGWTADIELSALFFRLTMDSATEFLFGQSAGAQNDALLSSGQREVSGKSSLKSIAQALDDATSVLGIRLRLGELYYLYSPRSFVENCQTVHAFADHCVQMALAKKTSKSVEESSGQKYVFLDELVKSTKDPVELRSQLLNILLAGRDTTAGLLGWTFWCLARHPEIYKKLRTTILESFGNYDNTEHFSFASLKACTYLQHVLKEVLRLYPSVPVNSRASNKDTSIPSGGGVDGKSPVYIPKGRTVTYSTHWMHRRKDLWGEDAQEFNPDRWINSRHGWNYLPFNGGPRICLGQQYALTEAGYVVARMVQRFDQLENLDTEVAVKYKYTITSAPLAVKVRMYTVKA